MTDTDTVSLIQVIKTTLTRKGKGVPGDPVRVLTQYWSLEGELLATVDPCLPNRYAVGWRAGLSEVENLFKEKEVTIDDVTRLRYREGGQ